MKKINWVYVAVGIGVILCAFLLFRGCYNPAKVKPAEVVKVVDTALTGRLARALVAANDREDIAAAKADSLSRELATAKGSARASAAKYREAISLRDTPTALVNCDSMAAQIDELVQRVEIWEHSYNVVMDEKEAMERISDSLASAQASFIAKFNTLYPAAVADRNELAKQLNKANGKVKRERLLTRILAGTVIGLAGYAVLK